MNSCVHHWLLEAPNPDIPDIKGVCKKCGEVKTFNYESFKYKAHNRIWIESEREKKRRRKDYSTQYL